MFHKDVSSYVLDLICVGLTTLDILGCPIDAIPADESGQLIDGIEVVPAGTAGGTAMVAARLGLRVALVSALGDDRIGTFVRGALAAEGVATYLTPSVVGARTSATILPIDSTGRRPTFHAVGASSGMMLLPTHYQALAGARFVHYGAIGAPRMDGGAGAAYLQAAKAAGAFVTCDLIAPRSGAVAEVARLLPFVDVFMPSLAEARFLTGTNDASEAALGLLGMGAASCVVKCGAEGVKLVSRDGVVAVPGFAVDVVDTTSCGDAFCAGFIVGLARGWEIRAAARFGCARSSRGSRPA